MHSPSKAATTVLARRSDVDERRYGRAPFVEDDLDEADFYAGQGMFSEAMGSLRVLAESHPNHPLILAKMRDVAALTRHGDHVSPPTNRGEAIETVDASFVALDRPA